MIEAVLSKRSGIGWLDAAAAKWVNRCCALTRKEIKLVKYFFLSDGWTVGRAWELGGLWNEKSWRRRPHIDCTHLSILEQAEKLWLYQVEEAVLMVEVKPTDQANPAAQAIGQVVLKRLITAEQVIERLCTAESISQSPAV